MAGEIGFYSDLVCPYSYLESHRVEREFDAFQRLARSTSRLETS